jgi:hypothetical protein
MTKNGYKLNEFGNSLLITAIKNCSEETQNEIAEELEKLRKSLT